MGNRSRCTIRPARRVSWSLLTAVSSPNEQLAKRDASGLDVRTSFKMARVAFISFYSRLALGIGQLVSCLKQEGHETIVLYLKRRRAALARAVRSYDPQEFHVMVTRSGRDIILSYAAPISDTEKRLLCSELAGFRPDLIALSLRTIAFRRAAEITDLLHTEFDVPVVWGGIEPTIEPERCIQRADIVCIGEGEEPLLELVRRIHAGESYTDVPGLWVRQDGEVTRNPVPAPIADLDALPFPDYSPENKFLIDANRLVKGYSVSHFNGMYEIMSSRGCPFSCSFCCSSSLKELHPRYRRIRRRSPEHVVGELTEAKRRYRVRYINVQDDVFTFDRDWIDRFAELYARDVGISFWAYVHPAMTDENTLATLKRAGLDRVTMGIQSGSERLLRDVYHRRFSNDKALQAMDTLEKQDIRYDVDIITNNPLETEQDCRQTFELLLNAPRHCRLNGGLSKLSVFPNTAIERLFRENKDILKADNGMFDFYNKLYLLSDSRLPKRFVKRLSRSSFLRAHPDALAPLFAVPWIKESVIFSLKNTLPPTVYESLREKLKPAGDRE
jgi:anaerobic magnesium-protoporphyrin IX monomethyl ester cyclase